ncbi:glycosyltransferase family 4 protein [Caenispirillum salinarum]|uniref:glycosyltransferase family 4 protein n=1 Tax=Caenispirillum salinarum TaxID=859058 RepID=UPI00384F0B62
MMNVYFYPHSFLRDRHLDTIRRWPRAAVVNPDVVESRRGQHFSRDTAVSGRIAATSWKQRVPLINVKRRPSDVPADAAVYVWGALMATGPFITELDNPYSLVGYNLRAMTLWRPVLKAILASRRCLEIRCMSAACRDTLVALFGADIGKKTKVFYPRMSERVHAVDTVAEDGPRFLFIGSQFDIKGGPALLKAFPKVRAALPSARMDIITHLPDRHAALADQPGVNVHASRYSRDELWEGFMKKSDVLVHPTYVDSFGMVVLEALAHGMSVIATDVYALREMVDDGTSGRLIEPPVSIWDGVLPAPLYYKLDRAVDEIDAVDTSTFESALADAMINIGQERERLLASRRASLDLFRRRFGREDRP